MSKVFMIGDLHFGHTNVHKFRDELGLYDEQAHREFLVDNWNSIVGKRDVVYVLGDACFHHNALPTFGRLNGRKKLIMGNHDLPYKCFEPYFEEIHGFLKYKKAWLSHAPIHPKELRGRVNIHGHVHYETIDDPRYFNVSCENIDYKPKSYEEIMKEIIL